jgi:FkbM family methyltransferase
MVLNSALSDSSREIDFYLCKKQTVSSVYSPNRDFLDNFPEADRFDIVKKIQLQTDTLDNQLDANGISGVDFIKVDAQGHELPILKGGGPLS